MEFTYEGNIFQDMMDAKELKRHLVQVTKVITDPKFPQSEKVEEDAKLFLLHLLEAVGEAGVLEEIYSEIMDLALDLTVKKSKCDATKPFFETIGSFFYHIKENDVKGRGKLFEGLVKKFIHMLDNVKDETYLVLRFAKPVVCDCLNSAMGTSKEHVELWITMIKSLVKHPTAQCMEAAYYALEEKEKLLKWKQYSAHVKGLFELLSKFTLPDWIADDEERDQCYEYHKKTTEEFLKGLEIAKMTNDMVDKMVHWVLDIMESRMPDLYDLGYEVAEKTSFNIKKDKPLIMEAIKRVTVALADDTHGWNGGGKYWRLNSLVQDLISRIMDCVSDGRVFTWDEYDQLIALVKFCQQQDPIHPESRCAGSVTYILNCQVGFKVINWLHTMNEIQRAAPLVPGIMDMMASEDDSVRDIAGGQMMIISVAGNLFASYVDQLITMFLDTQDNNVLSAVIYSYEHNPKPLAQHFQALFSYLDSGDSFVRSSMLQLVPKVAKYQPDLFTKDNMAALIKEAREDAAHQVALLMTIEEIAKRRPEKISPYLGQLMDQKLWQPMSLYSINLILQFYALRSEADSPKIVDFMIKQIQTSGDKVVTLSAFNAARLIGYKNRAAIEKHRTTLEKIKKETTDDDYRSQCVQIIDMLDGRSVDKIADELKALQVEVADIDIRVQGTEKGLTEVKDTVKRQGEEFDTVRKDVTEQGQRLEQVEETVQDTVIKVEEIDGKTLSHAPFWSRDVAKLLNPEAEHDWRLLSSRLGYSNDDIRSWAQQHDPCMAMLNEWYATHKTREATFAVLTALQDMSRLDAAVIVENAMKNAEAVVEDDEFAYATPPDVFISYQWGHQNEVRLLRQHLEMAGYSCWMDVGQMGGGDKLFEKIDSGIRGAKVVISCVTEKYAKSPNCNREVNLSVSLGKPIIPLLMETTTWPPAGSMGPIFSEYLYIRFHLRGGEQTPDSRYWPLDKFQELLMQLSINRVTPDEAAVQPEYKDWWIPKIEAVTVDKDRSKKQQSQSVPPVPVPTAGKEAASPTVFISYQWGRQPQIVRLYRALSALGYTCWLDIMQMGGGDSLYDKIDRGLRGCRVMLSCVTPKYALSANCRREVSLADALQKPIVPLLLESTSWPPPGPMGPILTQLLYIDCTRDPSLQETWQGSRFDEIVAKIGQIVTPLATGGVQTGVKPAEFKVKAPPSSTPVPPDTLTAASPLTSPPPPATTSTTPPPHSDGRSQKNEKRSEGHAGKTHNNNNTVRVASDASLSEKYGHEGHNESNNRSALPLEGSACCAIL